MLRHKRRCPTALSIILPQWMSDCIIRDALRRRLSTKVPLFFVTFNGALLVVKANDMLQRCNEKCFSLTIVAPSECGERQPNDDQITRDGVCSNTAPMARSSKCSPSASTMWMTPREGIQKRCVSEWPKASIQHRVSRSAPAHCRRSIAMAPSFIIRSGRQSVSNSKSL